jgi:tetratricopeptide (TPR) repeat protein
MSSLREHTLAFTIVLLFHCSLTLRHQDKLSSCESGSSGQTAASGSVQTARTSVQTCALDEISLADSMIALADELVSHPDKPLGPNEMWDGVNTEAVELYKRARVIKERVLGPRDKQLSEILCKLGYCSMRLSTSLRSVPAIVGERAENLYDRALSIDESNPDPALEDTSVRIRHLAEAAEVQEKFSERLTPKLRSLIKRWCRLNRYEPDVEGAGNYLTGLGSYYCAFGEWKLAEVTFKQAINRLEKDHENHFLTYALEDQAALYLQLGRNAEALALLERLLRLTQDPSDFREDFRPEVLSGISLCCKRLGYKEKYRRYSKILRTDYGHRDKSYYNRFAAMQDGRPQEWYGGNLIEFFRFVPEGI